MLTGQAAAICWLRGEDRVLGARNALRPLGGVVIGDAERALAAVDRYKESQTAGFVSMFGGPIVVVVGAVVATLLLGFTAVGVLLVAVLLAGSYFGLGAAVGLAVGQVLRRGQAALPAPAPR